MSDAPTTWRITPACATEDMRRSAAHILRLYVEHMSMDVAMEIAGKMWVAAMLASPPLPVIEDYPEFGAPR